MDVLEYLGPRDLRYGKVLQLYIGDNPSLVMGSQSYRHHEMLELVLKREGLEFEWQRLGPEWGPSPEGNGYRLAGAGWFTNFDGRIVLEGQSDGYRCGINREHAEAVGKLVTDAVIEVKARPPPPILDTNSLPKTSPLDDIPF